MNLKLLLIYLFLIVASITLSGQKNPAISGYLKDAANGETLIGANVYVKELGNGTNSNEYGYYSITLPPGQYTIQYSYLGFQTQEKIIELTENIKMDINLLMESTQLSEVVISSEAENSNVSNVEMSVNRLDMSTIQKMPTLLGEVEVL